MSVWGRWSAIMVADRKCPARLAALGAERQRQLLGASAAEHVGVLAPL